MFRSAPPSLQTLLPKWVVFNTDCKRQTWKIKATVFKMHKPLCISFTIQPICYCDALLVLLRKRDHNPGHKPVYSFPSGIVPTYNGLWLRPSIRAASSDELGDRGNCSIKARNSFALKSYMYIQKTFFKFASDAHQNDWRSFSLKTRTRKTRSGDGYGSLQYA